MATPDSIARPYAQAAYECARAKKEIPAWDKLLQFASTVVQQPAISELLGNSRISPEQWFLLFSDILSSNLNEERKNFLRLLAENKRLSALPTMALLFKEYEAADKQETEVQVITAVPMNDKQQQDLTHKLTKFLNHRVSLRCTVDEHILGGAIVRAGDKVLDGSVRGQLTRLLDFVIR